MRPEVLAPAGDPAAMRAAILAGADAVYLGLQAFNARARATNFDTAGLRDVMNRLHEHGVKGYVTLNTLIFEHELPALEETIRACADAGVDAVIVQDLGTVKLVRALAPTLPVHASTQMTCTDASGVEFAASIGASRVVVARELSLDEIEKIRGRTDTELEVFVHGALCVSYSGQCLTSEAIGGRSANRGACAQACRLPYELVVDGQVHDVGERAHLISPQDLEASHLVPRLAELGVSSLKIEGRLKGPDYVASSTRLYRHAVDTLSAPSAELRKDALLAFSRGSGPGFLEGVNHLRLVEGRTCEHRGLHAADVRGVDRLRGRAWLRIRTREPLQRGDGVLVEGGLAGAGEVGGRIWDLVRKGTPLASVGGGDEVLMWLGPDVELGSVATGRRVFLNSAQGHAERVAQEVERAPYREDIDVRVSGRAGEPLVLQARSRRGLLGQATSDEVLQPARERPLDEATLRDKLGRLGDTPYALGTLEVALDGAVMLPLSALNRVRRSLVDALKAGAHRSHTTTRITAADLLATASLDARPTPPPGLVVLCRTEEQAHAAHEAGADGIYLDFLALTGLGKAVPALRAAGVRVVGVAPPRIRKPGEEKIDRFLHSLQPDVFLVRGLGALHDLSTRTWTADEKRPLLVGDFSLNITNRLAAAEVFARGLDAFTPSFDLDAAQLTAFLQSPVGRLAEVVLHHPMPLFHMEHCVFAAFLGEGPDFRTCGRPCERHTVALRDRVGLDNPVEADIGCRNTVFHARPQSAASLVGHAQRAGTGRFRIELVRENAADVKRLVQTYRALLDGKMSAADVFKVLNPEKGYGVVRGSLRVLGHG